MKQTIKYITINKLIGRNQIRKMRERGWIYLPPEYPLQAMGIRIGNP